MNRIPKWARVRAVRKNPSMGSSEMAGDASRVKANPFDVSSVSKIGA